MSTILLLDAAGCCSIMCPAFLLWTLGAFLLGALLHWLFFCKKHGETIEILTKERDGLRAQLTNVEKDMASVKYQLDEANKDSQALKVSLSKCESDKAGLIAKAAVAAKAADAAGGTTALGIAGTGGTARGLSGDYAAILGTDNLQIVEGVGPKIDGLLKDAGINNWGVLGATSVDKLKEILDAAGSRYRLADPTTWPKQAQLAHDGKWNELIEYQKFLDTGVEGKGGMDTPSKVEKLIAKVMGFSTNPNDLKVVEGIGPKIEGLLKADGINTWSELAAASLDRLKGILAEAGDRYRLADPETWAKQAGLAAEGKWDELKSYQDFLSGGKNPG
jgi:predicted flap endonuclease-1-like 5' DNA nuclease